MKEFLSKIKNIFIAFVIFLAVIGYFVFAIVIKYIFIALVFGIFVWAILHIFSKKEK